MAGGCDRGAPLDRSPCLAVGGEAGEAGALGLLGFGAVARVSLERVRITPRRPAIGSAVTLTFDIAGRAVRPQRLLVDLRVHYVKANGTTGSKVFKLRELDLAPRGVGSFSKRLSSRN